MLTKFQNYRILHFGRQFGPSVREGSQSLHAAFGIWTCRHRAGSASWSHSLAATSVAHSPTSGDVFLSDAILIGMRPRERPRVSKSFYCSLAYDARMCSSFLCNKPETSSIRVCSNRERESEVKGKRCNSPIRENRWGVGGQGSTTCNEHDYRRQLN